MSDQHRSCIEQRAYELWEREGRPEGRQDNHWVEAERQIAAERAVTAAHRETPAKLKPSPAVAAARPRRKAARVR